MELPLLSAQRRGKRSNKKPALAVILVVIPTVFQLRELTRSEGEELGGQVKASST